MSSTIEIRGDSEEERLVTPEVATIQPGHNPSYLSEAEALNSSQSRNRIPLALCSQQTALSSSTPGASLSVDEPPALISTDDDTEQISSALGPHINTDPMMSSESTRSVPELELHCRTRADVHQLGSTHHVSTSVPSHDGLVCRHR